MFDDEGHRGSDGPGGPGPYSTDLGRCFRWVRDRVGRFDRCSQPVRWRGILVEIYGRRYAVDTCDRHRAALVAIRRLGD